MRSCIHQWEAECAFLYGHLSHKRNMEKWCVNIYSRYKQASSQALPGALVTGLEKEGELATTSLEFEFHLQSPSGLDPHCQISTNQHEAETRENVNKNWKTCAKRNDAITNVISANQHFALTFWCRYSNSNLVVASSPSFSRSRVPWRACSQARG